MALAHSRESISFCFLACFLNNFLSVYLFVVRATDLIESIITWFWSPATVGPRQLDNLIGALDNLVNQLGPVGQIIASVFSSLLFYGLIGGMHKDVVVVDKKSDSSKCHHHHKPHKHTKVVPLPIHIQHEYVHDNKHYKRKK